MQGLAPEDDSMTVIDGDAAGGAAAGAEGGGGGSTAHENEWNFILSRLIAADVTMVFTARSAQAAERIAFWLQGRPGLKLAPAHTQRNVWRSLRPLLGEPLADASAFTHPVQQDVTRRAGAAAAAAAAAGKSASGNSAASKAARQQEAQEAARTNALREWTDMLGGEGEQEAHGLNTSYGNQYVVIATRDDRRYSAAAAAAAPARPAR
jgi:hypothetical protein